MKAMSETGCTAFVGSRRIASGSLAEVASKAKAAVDRDKWAQPLIFDDVTGHVIDVDIRGTRKEVLKRLADRAGKAIGHGESTGTVASRTGGETPSPGRPRLGVVAREVTLLPQHWEWLASQSGGASAALRKLVEHARKANRGKDLQRGAREAAYRFISAMAGNEAGFEEATRALFAGDCRKFDGLVANWPVDVRTHAKKMASVAFEANPLTSA